MNEEQKENIREWIKVLRSGEYKQSSGELKGESGYCCLGVACMIHKIPYKERGHGFAFLFPEEFMMYPDPDWFKERFGFAFDQVLGPNRITLIGYNDGIGLKPKTFEEIADIIEKEMLK